MDNSVLQGILKQCREAMFASIPIVYIKTDSDIVIEELVKTKRNPLVTLVYNGVLESDEQKRQLFEYRPIYSLGEEYAQNSYIKNYKPNAIESKPVCFWSDYKLFPHIVTQKMPLPSQYDAEIIKKRRSILEQLEAYVKAYQNPYEANYEILQNSIIILYSSQVQLTPFLRTYTEVIEMEYPNEEEIRTIIKTQMGTELRNCVGDSQQLSRLCTDMRGFTAEEVRVLSQRILAAGSLKDTQTDNKSDTSKYTNKLIQKYKQQQLEGSVLKQVSFDPDTDIAGMVNFRTWLTQQSDPLNRSNEYKTKLGIDPPKGVLLCGIPGCGKSEAARFAAKTLNLPLLRMDVGTLMNKYVGESEKNMREALKMAEAMSPCILFIDEIEKGFSDAGAQGENGTFKRMFATLLGWMQDNTYPCFIFATANNISGLPKEFFRSGRFDQKFSVFLPDTEQCVAIFINSMKKAQNYVLKKTNRELFTQKCFPQLEKHHKDTCYLEEMIDKCLVDEHNKPRIIVGSDIQLAVKNALRICAAGGFDEHPITMAQWKKALEEAMSSETFTTYGEGDENVDAIVASYCQMLRKGFLNTSEQQLFRYEDYQASAFYDKEKWQKELDLCEDEKEAKALKKKISECKILKHSDIEKRGFHSKYDKAVYEFLYERINYMAFQIEAYERDKSIGLRR